MSDWADERAHRLICAMGDSETITEDQRALATALRQARADALEEAAKVADRQAWAHGGKYFDGPELNSRAISVAIRSLKDK